MNERNFIGAALAARRACLPALARGNAARGPRGRALLAVGGAITGDNREPFGPVRDQLALFHIGRRGTAPTGCCGP
jgi:hypothetical protein